MSDYFGALIRAAGTAVPGAARAHAIAAEGRAPVGPALPLEAVESSERYASVLHHDPTESSPVPQSPALARSETGREGAPSAAPGPLRRTATPLHAIAEDAGRAAAEPVPLAQALAQAAVRWVRAPHEAVRTQWEAGTGSGAPERENLVALRASGVPITSQADVALGKRADSNVPMVEREARLASPVMPAASLAETARHEGPFEVSIGSIHLRVEAPAAQTVVAAPSPVIAPPPQPARSSRSSLTRRALPRI